MRLISSFDAFMRNTVNINDDRLASLDDAVNAIYNALKNDDTIGPFIRGKDPQGSWAQRTIIKPVEGNEFDADFMLAFEEVGEWAEHPARYITEVHAALARHGRYESMVKPPKCRCTRVVYAGDFHVDIVPFLVLRGGRQVIVNRDEDDWEYTNPSGFTQWMRTKDQAAGGNLRKVIRLMKYLRDHGGNFKRTRSVLLTVMLGGRIEEGKKHADPNYYGDLPTALYHIISDLDEWLQLNPSKPSIVDPSGAVDQFGVPVNFDHRWEQEDYHNFRSKVHNLIDDIRAAYEEKDRDRSVKLWQAVFGSDFKVPQQPRGRLTSSVAAATPPSVQSGRAG